MKTQKVGNIPVKKVQLKENEKRKVRGDDIFATGSPYNVIGLIAPRKSGKSNLIYNILEKTVGKGTTVVIFSQSVDLDPTYLKIREDLEKKGNPVICHNSIIDENGEDILANYIESLKYEAACSRMVGGKKVQESFICVDEEEEEVDGKIVKSKYWDPEYTFVFDDISGSDGLKIKSLNKFVKMSRHFQSNLIMSSQSINDLTPPVLGQLTHLILFQGLPGKKEEHVVQKCRLKITPEQFRQVYDFATKEKYNFLLVNCVDNEYRHNFDERIII